MKKLIAFVLCMAFVLGGCAKKDEDNGYNGYIPPTYNGGGNNGGNNSSSSNGGDIESSYTEDAEDSGDESGQVQQAPISKVELCTPPTKTTYYTGESINLDGLSVTVTYSGGKKATVTEGFKCYTTTLRDEGTKTITVYYDNYSVTFDVTVNASDIYHSLTDGVLTVHGSGCIASSAFYDNEGIKKLVIEEGIVSIGRDAFSFCSNLAELVLPSSLVGIGDGAFGYTAITSFNIPAGATVTGNPFEKCSKLTKITVDARNKSLAAIDGVLFNKDRTRLIAYPIGKADTEYTVHPGVEEIGTYAFYYCDLKSVTLPQTLKSIEGYAFARSDSLQSIYIPDSVEKIEESAFYWATSLSTITVDAGNPNYKAIDGVLFNKDATSLIFYPHGKTDTAYKVPESVKKLETYAFGYCRYLKEITLGSSVESIATKRDLEDLRAIHVVESNASFSSVDGVLFNKDKTTLVLFPGGSTTTFYIVPNTVTVIEDYAFSTCDNIKSVNVPSSVTEIKSYAFNRCDNLAAFYYNGTGAQWASVKLDEDWVSDCGFTLVECTDGTMPLTTETT